MFKVESGFQVYYRNGKLIIYKNSIATVHQECLSLRPTTDIVGPT